MKKKQVPLPLNERLKKFLADLSGRDYLYFDFRHLPDHDLAEVIFDYNPAFLEMIADLGYDVITDPDAAVQEYIINCVAAVNREDEEEGE